MKSKASLSDERKDNDGTKTVSVNRSRDVIHTKGLQRRPSLSSTEEIIQLTFDG